MKSVAIISGGEFSPLDGIENADFIIACDKGLEYAKKSNVKPNLLVGDFDSFVGEIPSDIERLSLPVEKDDTDTMAAIRYCVEKGCNSITLYCALGGRLDHLIGNIQCATFAINNNIDIKIVDKNTKIFFIKNTNILLKKEEGYSLSVISISNVSKGVYIKGAKYPLNDAIITNDFPIGISNEWKNDVEISVLDGTLMIILSKI